MEVDNNNTGGVCDVVFLIECSAINGAYMNDMKTNYIIPALEYFSQNSIDDRDYLIEKNSSTLYGVVLYKTAQAMPNNSVYTFGPYNTAQKVLNVIEKLELNGGKSESNANLAEGLATSLLCFDDLKDHRRQSELNVQRYLILICNSSPYLMPVLENAQYENKNVEQLATILHEKNIYFSIISPRKVPSLFKLFIKADGGDVNTTPIITAKNYGKDIRHLVLLKGFNLKERPISPNQTIAMNGNNVASPLTSVNNNIDNQQANSILSSAQQNNVCINQHLQLHSNIPDYPEDFNFPQLDLMKTPDPGEGTSKKYDLYYDVVYDTTLDKYYPQPKIDFLETNIPDSMEIDDKNNNMIDEVGKMDNKNTASENTTTINDKNKIIYVSDDSEDDDVIIVTDTTDSDVVSQDMAKRNLSFKKTDKFETKKTNLYNNTFRKYSTCRNTIASDLIREFKRNLSFKKTDKVETKKTKVNEYMANNFSTRKNMTALDVFRKFMAKRNFSFKKTDNVETKKTKVNDKDEFIHVSSESEDDDEPNK